MESRERQIETARAWLQVHPGTQTALGLAVLLLIAWLADVVTRRYLVRLVERLTAKSPIDWDNTVARHGVFRHLAHLVPLV
ncbi:MAG: hypothetical protein JJE01_10910, partial [Gemmatimonadetes bacterium]|nr:hypothetical protein [Gemmatimonadota bacterium]